MLIALYLSIRHTGIKIIKNKTDLLQICVKFPVPQQACGQHTIDHFVEHQIKSFDAILIYNVSVIRNEINL